MADLKVKRVQIEIKVPLAEDACERRGVRLAAMGKDLRRVTQLAKDESASRRKEIKKAKVEIAELEDEIDSRTGKMMVDAEERPFFDTNTIRTIRTDSGGYGEVVAERAMGPQERQLALDVDADQPGDGEDDSPSDGGGRGKVVRIKGRKKKTDQPGAH